MAKLGSNISNIPAKVSKPTFEVVEFSEAVFKPVYVPQDVSETVVRPVYVVQDQVFPVKKPVYHEQTVEHLVKVPKIVETVEEIKLTTYNVVYKRDWILPGILAVSAIVHLWSVFHG